MWRPVALVLAALLLAGCAQAPSGPPRAVTPVTRVDLGEVPVVTDMRLAKFVRFELKNSGGANLKLGRIEVATLEGC